MGTEVWACKSESMLLLLALEGRDRLPSEQRRRSCWWKG